MKTDNNKKNIVVLKDKLIKLRVTAAEHDAFKRLAEQRGMTISDLVRMAVFPQDGVNAKRDS